MSLTKKDLQAIKDIVDDSIENAINGSETKMKQYIASQFRIQDIVLDTRFRKVNSRFDDVERLFQNHDQRIKGCEKRIDGIDERMPLHS